MGFFIVGAFLYCVGFGRGVVHVSSLTIRNLRIIREIQLIPGRDINWIVGGNGAGKTSVLEALFLLARGRSFRGSRHGPLTRRGSLESRISCYLDSGGVTNAIDFVERSGKKKLHENGSIVHRVRDLKERIHVRFVGENCQRLLEGAPEMRRMFLDWNLFHVEQRYFATHSSFLRALSQRNSWLRKGGNGGRIWDASYVSLSESVTVCRQAFVTAMQSELYLIHADNPTLPLVHLSFNCGWPENTSLADKLDATLKNDVHRGFTLYGPARADIKIQIEGLYGIGSRGQSKIVVCLLQHAAQRVLSMRTGISCIWLLDDIRAELSTESLDALWSIFGNIKEQVFVTALQKPDVSQISKGRNICMFHVEQGAKTI